MKLFFISTGLLVTTIASPWIVCQEPATSPAPATAPAPPLAVAPAQTTGQVPLPRPNSLPQVYTERIGYEYDWSAPNSQVSGPIVARYQQWSNPEERQAFAKAYAAYQAAKDEDSRTKAAEELKAGLAKQYDSFIDGQAKQIAELEERLAKLKEQLEKRRAAKERMVDLKLQMVLSQAEGLGFPDAGPPNVAFFYGDAMAPAIPPGVPQYPRPYPNPNAPQGAELLNQPALRSAPLAPAQAPEVPPAKGGGD